MTAVVYVAEQFGIPVECEQEPIGEKKETGRRKNHPSVEANQFVHPRFFRLRSLEEIPPQLRLGRPIVVGCKVYDYWVEAPSGEISAPDADKNPTGMMAITIVGHNPDRGSILFANAWSESWGQSGFGTMGPEAMQALLEPDMMWALDLPDNPRCPATTSRWPSKRHEHCRSEARRFPGLCQCLRRPGRLAQSLSKKTAIRPARICRKEIEMKDEAGVAVSMVFPRAIDASRGGM